MLDAIKSDYKEVFVSLMEEVENAVIQIVLQLHKVVGYVNHMAVDPAAKLTVAIQQVESPVIVSNTEVEACVELKAVENQLITVVIALLMMEGGTVGCQNVLKQFKVMDSALLMAEGNDVQKPIVAREPDEVDIVWHIVHRNKIHYVFPAISIFLMRQFLNDSSSSVFFCITNSILMSDCHSNVLALKASDARLLRVKAFSSEEN